MRADAVPAKALSEVEAGAVADGATVSLHAAARSRAPAIRRGTYRRIEVSMALNEGHTRQALIRQPASAPGDAEEGTTLRGDSYSRDRTLAVSCVTRFL